MKMAVIAMLLCVLPMTCSAESLQDRIGTDKCAHFAVSYVINDQLHRNTKLTPLERFGVVAAIGAVKELTDDHWDSKDFAADCAGALFYEVKF